MLPENFKTFIINWISSEPKFIEYMKNILIDEIEEIVPNIQDDQINSIYSSLSNDNSLLFRERFSPEQPIKGEIYFFENSASNDGFIGVSIDDGDQPLMVIGDSGFLGFSTITFASLLVENVFLGVLRIREYHSIVSKLLPIRLFGISKSWLDLAPTATDIQTWVNGQSKTFFPDEPATNYDQFTLPTWFDSNNFYSNIKLFFGIDADKLIGDRDKSVHAKYFVIHDTAGNTDPPSVMESNKTGVHLWLGVNNFILNNDWHLPGDATKLEAGSNSCFVHTELTRHKKELEYEANIKSQGTRYTHGQYEKLALAYVITSIRKGFFLTVSIHRELDRAISNGHDDPKDFDINRFYRLIHKMFGLKQGTFGIQESRLLSLNQGNQGGYVNEFFPFIEGNQTFANQYGKLRRNPDGSWDHHTKPTTKPICT